MKPCAGAALPRTDGSERDCVFFLSVRDERALHGCERALVADAEPKRLLLFSIGGLLLSRSLVAATGDGCTVRANESLNRRFAVRVSVNG